MLALSAVLLTFSFQFSLLFFNISLTRQHQSHIWLWAAPSLQRTIGQYRATDIAENLGTSLSGAQRTNHGKDREVILTVKMETRHPVWGPFGRVFLVSVIIAEL